MSVSSADIQRAYGLSASEVFALNSLAGYLQTRPEWIANVIRMESGWNPVAVNAASNATGLIQFLPSTANRLGTSVDAIKRLSRVQQLNGPIRAYFAPYRGRLNSQLDVAMAVFYPVAIGKGESYRFPSNVPRYNPGIYTAGDYLNKLKRVARLPTGGRGGVRQGTGAFVVALALSLIGTGVLIMRSR